MQKYLKAIIALEIFVLIWQYYFRQSFAELKQKKQTYITMNESSKILEQKIGNKTRRELYLEILEQQKENIVKEKEKIDKLFPSILTTRNNLFSPFEGIKKKLNNEIDFKIIPEKEYHEQGNMVYWRYDLEATDTFANIIKLLAAVESNEVFLRILGSDISTNGKLVDLKMQIEVAYSNVLPDNLNGDLK